MRKRLLLSAGTMAGLVGVVLVVVVMLPSGPGVTKANFDKIEKGMTFDQVTAYLGKPSIEPGVFDISETRRDWVVDWYHDNGSSAVIWFASGKMESISNGKVLQMTWHESSETVFDKFRRWLHLLPPPPPPAPPAFPW